MPIRKIFPRLLTTVVLLLVLMATQEVWAQTKLSNELIKLPSTQLLEIAQRNMKEGVRTDTAMISLTIVANRYEKSMSREEKRQCMEAYMRMWTIYFYTYYDYAKCFDCLIRAHEIANEAGLVDINIYLGFGCMYQTVSEQNDNKQLAYKALEYYRLGLQSAVDTEDYEHEDMACTNVLAMAFTLDMMDSIATEWQQYIKHNKDNDKRVLYRYNKLLYEAIFHNIRGEYDEALETMDRQLALIEHTEYARLVYFTYIERSRVQAKKGNYVAAIAELEKPEAIAMQYEMKDCKLETYGLLTDYYKQAGNTRLHDICRERYFLLKDTLTNYHQLASVNEMEFRQELKKMDDQMTEIKHHRKVLGMVIAAVIVFALVVLVFLLIVFRQNSRLKKSYRSLYKKNVALLHAEEVERQNRKKYTNSTLTDDDKSILLNRITDVMENNEEVFSPDFSVERLAHLVDSKYKYVSQVIHEKYDCNFNTFINDYRIKEACKRISDTEHFGRLTIEGISNSVGFKSRSSFAIAFKRVTGLTPSEYQRLAQEEKR